MDELIGSVTGTATFERVEVESSDAEGAAFEVTGYYDEEPTVYRTPRLQVGGLEVTGAIEGTLTVEPEDEGGWVWTVAEEDVLSLDSEKPEEDEDGDDQ